LPRRNGAQPDEIVSLQRRRGAVISGTHLDERGSRRKASAENPPLTYHEFPNAFPDAIRVHPPGAHGDQPQNSFSLNGKRHARLIDVHLQE
jgi:hypothetical protein